MFKTIRQGINEFKKELRKEKQKQYERNFKECVERDNMLESEMPDVYTKKFLNDNDHVAWFVRCNEKLNGMAQVLGLTDEEIKEINKDANI